MLNNVFDRRYQNNIVQNLIIILLLFLGWFIVSDLVKTSLVFHNIEFTMMV